MSKWRAQNLGQGAASADSSGDSRAGSGGAAVRAGAAGGAAPDLGVDEADMADGRAGRSLTGVAATGSRGRSDGVGGGASSPGTEPAGVQSGRPSRHTSVAGLSRPERASAWSAASLIGPNSRP